jgi:hypothetical protein
MIKMASNVLNSARAPATAMEIVRMPVTAMVYAKVPKAVVVAMARAAITSVATAAV